MWTRHSCTTTTRVGNLTTAQSQTWKLRVQIQPTLATQTCPHRTQQRTSVCTCSHEAPTYRNSQGNSSVTHGGLTPMSHQHAVLAPSAGRIQHRTQYTDTRLELLAPLLFQRDGLSLKRWVSTVQERKLGQASSSPAPSHKDEFCFLGKKAGDGSCFPVQGSFSLCQHFP